MKYLLVVLILITSVSAKADPMADIYIEECKRDTHACTLMTAAAREIERFNKLMSQKDEQICYNNSGLKDFSESILWYLNLPRDEVKSDVGAPLFAFAVGIAGARYITCE